MSSNQPLNGNISFNAQHSPMGAFMSFTCGNFGTRGGFGLQIGKPGNQNLYIGVKSAPAKEDAPLRCLPFFEGAQVDEAARYDVEKAAAKEEPSILSYARDQIKRYYGWGSDRWVTPDFEFTIYTRFDAIPDPQTAPHEQLRDRLLPAVVAELVIDNTSGQQTKTGIFGLTADAGVHLLPANHGSRGGFAYRREWGVLGEVEGGQIIRLMRWSAAKALTDVNPIHMLGTTPALAFEVPPGERRRLKLVLGCYLEGIVTTRLEGKYLYTRWFTSLHDVLEHGLSRFELLRNEAIERDTQLAASKCSADQQFLIAHATRSYYGSTQLLDVGGEPFWIVNEGEYCMMNTLDLSVDHVFWELDQNPWLVRNLLDNYVRHYSYIDQVRERPAAPGPRGSESPLLPGGLSFCHDMGIHNNFSPQGHSSYELSNLNAACFSYMTAEQLCNWTLMAACYTARTKDDAWLRWQQGTIEACLTSMINRGGQAGFCQHDSSRCGTGAEITTYDSLDHSLAQTRNNVYMAVKSWAAYRGLAMMLGRLGSPRAHEAAQAAERVSKAVQAQAGKDGVLPAVFEKDNPGYASRILPAIEGLIYPWFWGETIDPSLLECLKRHTVALLKDPERRNLFPDGGIKLSSTSNNSWMSKIAIFMHVARKVMKLDQDPAIAEIFARADAAHVKWETDGSSYWACCDQIVSGVAHGSKYYPRIITTALWMG